MALDLDHRRIPARSSEAVTAQTRDWSKAATTLGETK